MPEIRTDTLIWSWVGFGVAILQTKYSKPKPRKKRLSGKNAPRSSETVMMTPLHGLELDQAWAKNLKWQKPYKQHKMMHVKQITYLYLW